MDTAIWTATWSFTSRSGVSTGSASAAVFKDVKAAVTRAAEASLSGLTEKENDEMDDSWNRFLSSFELHAEVIAKAEGGWEYSNDGWAQVKITRIA